MIFNIRDEGDRALLQAAFPIGARVGLTSGTFDLFHHLHLVYLQRCRRQCDVLVVGVDSDDLVRAAKGPERPIVPEHQRVSLVGELKCVTAAFVLGDLLDFEAAVARFNVTRIFKNQRFRPEEVIGRDRAEVVIVPDVVQAGSTSGIIEEIKRRRSAPREETR